jgi:hypothetical protein
VPLELHVPIADWYKLSLALRQRWWEETDFSRLPPNDDLKAAIETTLGRPIPWK